MSLLATALLKDVNSKMNALTFLYVKVLRLEPIDMKFEIVLDIIKHAT